MENTTVIIAVAATLAALVTFLITYIISSSKIRDLKSDLAEKKSQLQAKDQILKERQSVYEKTLSELKQSHDRDLKIQLGALKSEVEASTQTILKQRQDELAKDSRQELGEILDPLKESIETMKKALSENEKENLKSSTELKASLEQAVKSMEQRTAAIGVKADNLSEALTGRPKMQGCWGENLLDDILAKEGLEKGVHYDREVSGDDLSRPDFVFHFMDGMDRKDLVVDSKVSLTAFVDYMNAEDETLKADALARHIKSVKKHIDELASKDYARKIDHGKRFADYVLMFMPIDMAYRVAIDADYTIWQYAYSKGIVITTEQTIMPFLKVIRLTWNKYSQDSNIMEIMSAAEMVVERVGLFYDSYRDLGKKLGAACKEYNSGLVKLEDNGKSITTSARRLMKLGAKRTKGKELSVPDESIFLAEDDSMVQ